MRKSNIPDDEALLLDGLINHSQKAYSELYNRYANTLLGVINRMIYDETAAQDLLQETFIKVWLHIHRYDPGKGRLFTWLLHIARNTALDYMRSHQNDCLVEFQLRMGDVTFTNVTLIGLKETVLAALEPPYKPMIELIYFQGFTHQEVADLLSLPLGTVKSRVRMALMELKKTFSSDNSLSGSG